MNDFTSLLEEAAREYPPAAIQALFEKRLAEVGMTQHQTEQVLDIEHKSLEAILNGTAKRVDLLNALKLGTFLKLNANEFTSLYARQYAEVGTELTRLQSVNYILDTFDLATLKRHKILDSKKDFGEVALRLKEFFGVQKLEDVAGGVVNPAFSRVKRSTNDMMRDFWVKSAHAHLKSFDNPYPYERKQLLELIPKIRPYTINVEQGLITVIQALFHAGVTVMYQPVLTGVSVRGATFAVNGKPAIVLTDYNKSYPTLWFALLHELHHVLHDWEQIQTNTYHLTGQIDPFLMNEEKADEFARDFLCSRERSKYIRPHLNNPTVVNRSAREWQIHPSIIYNFAMYDMKEEGDEKAWSRYRSFFPKVEDALRSYAAFSWSASVTANAEAIKKEIFPFIA